jgi:hypothetical protein
MMGESEIDDEMVAIIKGMLARGDKQSDIAACFLINGGRISEINTGQRFADVTPKCIDDLPPRGPYPSPYTLWRAVQSLWAARIALAGAAEKIKMALVAVENAEERVK